MKLWAVRDASGRNIHLTKERWKHITTKHTNISNVYPILRTLQRPNAIQEHDTDPKARKYKGKDGTSKLTVLVKSLNGKGFVITAYHT